MVRQTAGVSQRRRQRRRAPLIAIVALLAVGVAVGGLWASTERTEPTDGTAREIQALRERGTAQAGGGEQRAPSTPALCRTLRLSDVGRVQDDTLVELSGLVQSRRRGGPLWAIQDSGAAAELIALRTSGATVGRWTVSGAQNVDWEDLATGPGPGGTPWLYAADLGDNQEQREAITIYRVPEPRSPRGGGTTAPAQALQLRYPDGARDAESFLVDPRRGTLVVITKGVPGSIYVASRPSRWGGTVRLRRIAGSPILYATAADVSADGRTVAVRGYFNVAAWQRRGDEPLTTTLRREACVSPTGLDEGQGEAIAVGRDGSSAWTVSEGKRQPIRRLTPR